LHHPVAPRWSCQVGLSLSFFKSISVKFEEAIAGKLIQDKYYVGKFFVNILAPSCCTAVAISGWAQPVFPRLFLFSPLHLEFLSLQGGWGGWGVLSGGACEGGGGISDHSCLQ